MRLKRQPDPPSSALPQAPSIVAAVLFDLDGTLVDSRIDFGRMRQEMLELAAQAGCDLAALEGADILEIRDAACLRACDSGAALTRAEARLVAIEREALERSIPVAGARSLLLELQDRRVRVGIVTRNCREIAEDALRRHRLPYNVLVAREDTPRVKPHPDHLHQALRLLEVPLADTVMVGDGRMDVQAGRAAGMYTVGYLDSDRRSDYFSSLAPNRVIHRLADLLPWIFPSSS
jgi:phosphoglycolate phosphatase